MAATLRVGGSGATSGDRPAFDAPHPMREKCTPTKGGGLTTTATFGPMAAGYSVDGN